MSVEEARAAIEEEFANLNFKRGIGSIDPQASDEWYEEEQRTMLDRLILEVQAEMPCSNYWVAELQEEGRCPALADVDWISEDARRPCPSCTARMKLKETTDEPLPGTRAV